MQENSNQESPSPFKVLQHSQEIRKFLGKRTNLNTAKATKSGMHAWASIAIGKSFYYADSSTFVDSDKKHIGCRCALKV